jgi:isoleucyl-tRNA synthetase
MKLKDTLNLPQTTFPMRLDKQVAAKLLERTTTPLHWSSHPSQFTLHDGPPFANGDIHLGHAVNKVVKDITCRLKTKDGYVVNFRPGWDCHGLPIETQVKETYTGPQDVPSFREACAAHAHSWMEKQMDQFIKLGVRARWDDAYYTMSAEYESNAMRAFGRLVNDGLISRKLKPVHWSIENETALAVGELEYKDVTHDSIYVGFEQFTTIPNARRTQFLVWTTTPWTLPANAALAINANATYVRVEWQGKVFILAEERAEAVCPGHKVLEKYEGKYLSGMKYIPLFNDMDAVSFANIFDIYHADFVDTKTGTGIVHIAPAHGMEDYMLGEQVGLNRNLYCPVLRYGTYADSHRVPEFLRARNIWDAQHSITAYLNQNGRLHGIVPVTHSYPHDWRSGKETIMRAEEQWFIALDKPFGRDGKTLREKAIEACEGVEFVPPHSKNRFLGMLKSRPDWCISRQRSWGLPIPAFYDADGKALVTQDAVNVCAEEIGVYGSNYWYKAEAAELIRDPLHRPLRKEQDTFDVWFDSGTSFMSVAEIADVYIEGSDQHRGWFQHSLLLSVALRGKAPFKKLVTHGFVVKPDGTKVSKKDKEYVRAAEMEEKIGADPIRLWIASNNFQDDICASPDMIEKFAKEKYAKVRNTIKFLISVLYDYNPQEDFVFPPPGSLDAWIVWRLGELKKACKESNGAMAYHTTVASLMTFCNNDFSATYANAMKDRLYCARADSHERRRTQSVMHMVLISLMDMLEPFIPLTVAEARDHYSHWYYTRDFTYDFREEWKVLFDLRASALASLDDLKKTVGLNKATDANVVYYLTEPTLALLQPYGADLEDIVGAGGYELKVAAKDSVIVFDVSIRELTTPANVVGSVEGMFNASENGCYRPAIGLW